MSIKTLLNKTQADGQQELKFDEESETQLYGNHQIQVTVKDAQGDVALASLGTLEIKARGPKSDEPESIENGVIDLTNRDNWLTRFSANLATLYFIPTGLDANKTYNVVVTSTP